MSKNQTVNGYKIPSAGAGVAVWKALYNVLTTPGITQTRQLLDCANFSGLNHSTLGWLTSPGANSPAEKLWDRRKEGVFKLYPNEWTQQAFDNIVHPNDVLTAKLKKQWTQGWSKKFENRNFRDIKVGDFVYEQIGGVTRRWGTFICWVVTDGGRYGSAPTADPRHRENYFDSIDDICGTYELQSYNVQAPENPLYSVQRHLEAKLLIDGKFQNVMANFIMVNPV